MNEYAIVDTVTGTVLASEGCMLVHHNYITDDVLSSDAAISEVAKEHGMTLPDYFDRPDDY